MWRVLRMVLWVLTRLVFRIRMVGEVNVPRRGPALLVSNHVSYADGFLIGACITVPVCFLTWKPLFRVAGFRWILQEIKAIPVGDGLAPRETAETIQLARQALAEGYIVCIFPEGSITRTGELLPFKQGMEKIVDGLAVPIVPINLEGLWGSIFSFEGGKFFWKRPRHLSRPVTISFGEPMRAGSTAHEVRQAIQGLAAAAGRGSIARIK